MKIVMMNESSLIFSIQIPVECRGRHPGQGPRDPAVRLLVIWDGDRNSNSKFAGFGTRTEIRKILDSCPAEKSRRF